MDVIATWIRQLAKRLNYTQPQLARLLRCRVECVSLWMRGERTPRAYLLLRLLALATDEERASLLNHFGDTLDDHIPGDDGSSAVCEACGKELRIHDFTSRGWPPPPLKPSPYTRPLCVDCLTASFGPKGN